MIVKKITNGCVIQSFDTDKQLWVSQEFMAGDLCDYETEDGCPISDYTNVLINDIEKSYLPFEMKQPQEI